MTFRVQPLAGHHGSRKRSHLHRRGSWSDLRLQQIVSPKSLCDPNGREPVDLPGPLKLRASLPLKINGWKMIHFLLGWHFSGAMLASGSVLHFWVISQNLLLILSFSLANQVFGNQGFLSENVDRCLFGELMPNKFILGGHFCHTFWTTLPPIIMVQLKMGPSNSSYLSNTAIFRFQDYGRKGAPQ